MKKTLTRTKTKVKTGTMVAIAIAVISVGGIMAAGIIKSSTSTLTPPASLSASCDGTGKLIIKWSRAKNNSEYYDIRIVNKSSQATFEKNHVSETNYSWQGQSGKTYDVWVNSNSGISKASAWIRNVACKNTCTDSDSGLNYNTKGTCRDSMGAYGVDECIDGQLSEKYCTSKPDCFSKIISCPNGCKDGVCIPTPPAYSCTGTTPANATLCSGDSTGLTANTAISLVSSCTTSKKCEYICKSGYQMVNGACQPMI